jgi:WD40 repeat protein
VTRLRGAAGGRSESEVLASGPSVGVIAFSLAFSPDGRLLAEARPREVTIWDVATRAKVGRPLSGVPGAFYGVAFAPDGKMLATGSGDGTVRLWDATARTVIGTLHGHQFWVRSLGFAAGGVLVTANGGGSGGVPASVRLWDVATRKPLAVLPADSSWPGAPIALSPDRKTVATGSPDHHVTLWDVGSRRKVATLEGVANVLSLAFSPDGKSLAGGDRDGSFHLWNLARGTRTHRPRAHLGPITAIAFSPDSQTLATGSGDRTVRLWRPGIDQEVATLIGHQRVLCVAFSPDGNLLAMGSADGTARLWQAAPLAETEAPRRASVRRTARAPAR